ncbi:MAG TPA: hypothetical protein VF121_12135 [Thermoanaerobaculia bacterium]|nr:hypothetical protein [Thermoanaerobaculia bacterium]
MSASGSRSRGARAPRERTFWLLLVSIVVVGSAAGLLRNGATTIPLELAPGAPQPQPQVARQRTWREVPFMPIAAIPAGEGQPLRLPTLLRAGPSGEAYVLDSGGPAVGRISRQGELESRRTVAGAGDPTDLAVARDGSIWIADPDRGRVHVLPPAGAAPQAIDLEVPAVRIFPRSEGFIATPLRRSPALFLHYDGEGRLLSSFGRLFPESVQSALTIDGWMVDAGAGAFVFLFRHAGLLAAFEADGSLRFIRRTVNLVPLPAVHVDAAGRQRLDPEAPLASIAGGIVGGSIFVLSAAGSERSLDVYDAAEGTYRYSLRPPETAARYVAVTGDRFYSASRRGVTVWQWTPPGS